MHIERPRPAVVRLTLSAPELSALIAAARWALEGCTGDIEPEAKQQLGQVLSSYDKVLSRERSR